MVDSAAPSILILGVGNELLTDEGVGVHAALSLEKEGGLPANVRIVEGGTDGFSLISVIQGVEHIIIIDAVKAGGEPGAVYRFTPDDVTVFPDVFKTSMHQISLQDVITLVGVAYAPPRSLTIVGVEPASLEVGMELSPTVAAKLPRVVEIVREQVARIMSEETAATA